MILEKVYDELLGMIEDLKKKVAGISGGSTVTITPTLESGVKVADYSIDETSGSIYAPTEIAGVYASAETKVGTINGADAYRKYFSAENIVSGDNTVATLTDADTVIIEFAEAIFNDSGVIQKIQLPYYYAATDKCFLFSRDNVIKCSAGSAFAADYTQITFSVLYTKTAPEAKKTTKKK